MTFDGAAYYGLPTAGSSSAPAYNNYANSHAGPPSSRGSSRGTGRGRGLISRPARSQQHFQQGNYPNQQANYPQYAQNGPYTYANGFQAAGVMQSMSYQNAKWSGVMQQQQPMMQQYDQTRMQHQLPMKPQAAVQQQQSQAWQQQSLPTYPSFPNQSSFPSSQMYNAQGYGISPTAHSYSSQPSFAPPQATIQESEPAAPVSISRSLQQGSSDIPYSRPSTSKPYCQLCKRSFASPVHLIAHQRNEHVRCCKASEGCKYEGLPADVEIHEQDRHLIFKPGAQPEVTKPDGPQNARIQGCNVTLDTEEDIAKWIEERKRKWPTKQNAEAKAERDAKRRAYNEASPANVWQRNGPAEQRGRGAARARGTRGGRGRDSIKESHKPAPADACEDDSMQNQFASQQAEPATVESQDVSDSASNSSVDEEEEARIAMGLIRPSIQKSADSVTGDAPDGLHDAASDASDVEDERLESESEDSGPEVEYAKTEAISTQPEGDASSQPSERQPYRPKPCNSWVSTGTCKFGKRCTYSHDPSARGSGRKQPKGPLPPPVNPFERDGLLGKLLHNEIKHEMSDLCQVIDFLARNSWLENVELYPGQKEEVENRIKVVKEQESQQEEQTGEDEIADAAKQGVQ